jgi:hypothetical protein
MTCPDCERYKKSAAMWRNKAYEAAGHPLPWKPDELWQGLTDEELRQAYCEVSGKEWCLGGLANAHTFYDAIKAKLKEKNT